MFAKEKVASARQVCRFNLTTADICKERTQK
jgi:hypothetical protein